MAKRNDIKNHCGKKSGKKNKVPKNISLIIERIEKLDFVRHVNTGIFKPSNREPTIEIIGYDHQTRKYIVNIHGGKYVQKVLLDVPQQNDHYEQKISSCI
jgi:hypothetical protein